MSESEIIEVLGTHSELKRSVTVDHPAWRTFVARMRSRQYGYEALSSAWGWYSSGWYDGFAFIPELFGLGDHD